MRKSEMIKVFMERDGMSRVEAESYYKDVVSEVSYLLEGGDYDAVEDYFQYELGLEMDYLF